MTVMSMSVWKVTSRLLRRFLASGERLDSLLETLPDQMAADERRRCRHLLYGAVRHLGLLEAALREHVPRKPRPGLSTVLLLGAFELLENGGSAPVIVHHAVEQARDLTSAGEARLVNAVLRRLPETLARLRADSTTDAAALAVRFSHPEWLVARWLGRFGPDPTLRLLEWNQQPAPVHARLLEPSAEALPDFFRPTPWPGFFRLERLDWSVVESLLAAGRIYLQDPATALAPGLLAVVAGETVLDVCAAPGGKTLQLAAAVGPTGRVVALDLNGARLERMRRNLARHPSLPIATLGADATKVTPADFTAAGLPDRYDAVLLDAPCSNTGVLRHRVDVKARLQPRDLEGLARLQLALLARAADLVRPGGRLVYATCSLEAEENADLVARFLAESGDGFVLEDSVASLPWETGHDGAGAFRLRRAG